MSDTELERQVSEHLIQAWNLFVSLEQTHPSDIQDFNHGIHLCQYVMGMRLLRREHPEIYPTHIVKKEK